MAFGLTLELILIAIAVIQMIVIIVFFSKTRQGSQEHVLQKFIEYEKKLDENETSMRDEFGRNREETNKSARDAREELTASLKSFTELVDNKIKSINELFDFSSKSNREELNKSIHAFEEKVSSSISGFSEILNKELKSVQDTVTNSTRLGREELSNSLKIFEEKFSAKIETLTKDTNQVLEKNRETVEKKLADIQRENGEKLEKMRETVDEKLHKTLETRLGESFKLVSERLELVQKGLGEMQNLAAGVGDLKKVLSNVKTKGVLGEYQLGAILEQLLAPNQYAQNVATKTGSRDNVEFAVKIPSKEDSNKVVWLPIDSKFPTVDYESLMDAYDAGDTILLEKSKKDLETKIKNFAKDIRAKYVEPPNTTEFAIMFLPFEGLYAEVLRIPNLFETIQNTYKITIAGPTTISAFLNSLQMGFRSLAVEKRTSEIWDVLSAVRTEFGKFGDILEAAKKKIDQASAELEKTGTRTRKIEKQLQRFDELPDTEAQKLLEA
jgi:DNA recombination protein RmuC